MNPQSINCLRCQSCTLLPETNMAERGTVIFCGKLQAPKCINLEGCPAADPREIYVGGDRRRFASEVEKAFLVVHYPRGDRAKLLRATGRSQWMSVVHIANKMGLARHHDRTLIVGLAAQAVESKRRTGQIFNSEQSAYIQDCYARGYWPQRGGVRNPEKLKRAQYIKRVIVRRVRQLDENGKRWEWRSIWSHIKWVSPSYRRDTPAKNRAKRDRKKVAASTSLGVSTPDAHILKHH